MGVIGYCWWLIVLGEGGWVKEKGGGGLLRFDIVDFLLFD